MTDVRRADLRPDEEHPHVQVRGKGRGGWSERAPLSGRGVTAIKQWLAIAPADNKFLLTWRTRKSTLLRLRHPHVSTDRRHHGGQTSPAPPGHHQHPGLRSICPPQQKGRQPRLITAGRYRLQIWSRPQPHPLSTIVLIDSGGHARSGRCTGRRVRPVQLGRPDPHCLQTSPLHAPDELGAGTRGRKSA